MDAERPESRKRNYPIQEGGAESVDTSLTLQQASSLFTLIIAGEVAIKKGIFKFDEDKELADKIKELILKDGTEFKEELSSIIEELDTENYTNSKIILLPNK